jgi:excinuclease ABC subunit C
LAELGIDDVALCGLAKRLEEVWLPEDDHPVVLPRTSEGLYLLQRVRDEAHRFAITFHRQSRARRDLRSGLDTIAGVGPRRRKALLTAFGSLAGVRRATREELIAVVGVKTADQVLAYFASDA